MADRNSALNDEDLLLAALRAAAEGPFFPDTEFGMLNGFSRDDLRSLIERWPCACDEAFVDLAITNVVVNLTEYPHGRWADWARYSGEEPASLIALLQHWRAGSYKTPPTIHVDYHQPEEQSVDRLIETYFRDLSLMNDLTEPGADSSAALDAAGYDGSLFDWFAVQNFGPPDGAEQAWPVMLEVIARAPDEMSLGLIGASVLEDLIRNNGETFALRLIQRSACDPRFRVALHHVWFGDSPAWLRERLLTVVRGIEAG
jgi:hypothetical protein